MSGLEDDELLYLARAFTLFLNLANIAEQHHQVRQRRLAACQSSHQNYGPGSDPELDSLNPASQPSRGYLEKELGKLLEHGIDAETLYQHVCRLNIDLVLTAHPTEVLRRSISSKYLRIAGLLAERDRKDLSLGERQQIVRALYRTVIEVWETDEIRRVKPTPVDEAKTGLVTLEQSLWNIVPDITRELDQALQLQTGRRLPVDAVPVRFSSWMGGDRDGNPNATPEVTRTVCRLSRLRAAELFWREIDELRRELSMTRCDSALRAEVGEASIRHDRDSLRNHRRTFSDPEDGLHLPSSLLLGFPGDGTSAFSVDSLSAAGGFKQLHDDIGRWSQQKRDWPWTETISLLSEKGLPYQARTKRIRSCTRSAM